MAMEHAPMKSWVDCPLCRPLNVKLEDVDTGDLCDKHYRQNKAAESDLMRRSQQASLEMLRLEVKHLRGFAEDLLNIWPQDIGADDVQDLAVKHSLLKETTQYERCGENCFCSEYVSEDEWEGVATCYRKTEILTGE